MLDALKRFFARLFPDADLCPYCRIGSREEIANDDVIWLECPHCDAREAHPLPRS